MRSPATPDVDQIAAVVLHGLLFLFFFQLLSHFVEAIYAFGLLRTGIPLEIVSVLLLFSPLVLLFLPSGLSGWGLVLAGWLALASRAVEVMLDTRGRMLVAGFGMACFLVFFPSYLRSRGLIRSGGGTLGSGLALGLALSIVLGALNSGVDLTTQGWFQSVGWVSALLAGTLLWIRLGRAGPAPEEAAADRSAGIGKVAGLSLGLTAALVLLYFAFAAPNVIARWTGASYLLVLAVTVAALCLFAVLLAARPAILAAVTPGPVLAWNVLFVASLVLTILAHQIRFPSEPGAYPLFEPEPSAFGNLALLFTLLLFPVVLVDFVLFARELVAVQPAPRSLGLGFGLASLFLLIMILAQVFTTVYAYIPVVGPFFRDKFWLVFLTAGVALALPLLLVARQSFDLALPRSGPGPAFFAGAMIALGVIAVAGAALTIPRPVPPPGDEARLRVMTYNVQQGYSEDGLKNYDGQLALIRQVDADLIGLQESDTNRIAGGNSDLVRYFADKLDLHSYYGPKSAAGTFGIALLSKYPIEAPRTFYLYSEGEQTAAIAAQVTAGGKTFHVLVTHLGNGGPIAQQEDFLQEVAGRADVIAMGDFNFKPGTDQYRLTTAVLDDAWLLRWPQGVNDRGLNPADRIDHVFVSPGTVVAEAQYLGGSHSDHPAVAVDIRW